MTGVVTSMYTLIFLSWAASGINNWRDGLHCIRSEKVWEINVVNQHGTKSGNCNSCFYTEDALNCRRA